MKLAFLIYIVLPQSKGSIVVFNQYLKPFLKKREEIIDNYISSMIHFFVDRLEPIKLKIFNEDSSRTSEDLVQESNEKSSESNNDSFSDDEILSSPKIKRRGSKKLAMQKNSPVKNLKGGITSIAKHLAM